MLFLTLPLDFALSAALSCIPDFDAVVARAIRRFFTAMQALLFKSASEDSVRFAPALSLLFVTAMACILGGVLGAVHTLLCAPLIAPLIPLPGLIRNALAVRETLEEGACASDEERAGYERQIMDAIGVLAEQCAQQLFVPLLLSTLLLPLHLAPAAFGMLYALRLLAEECVWARKANAFVNRIGDALMTLCVIPTAALCGTEMGMALRARRRGAKDVLLSTVGVDPTFKSGHRPVTGDISQSCLCVCVALGLMYAVVTAVMFVLLARFAAASMG